MDEMVNKFELLAQVMNDLNHISLSGIDNMALMIKSLKALSTLQDVLMMEAQKQNETA